MIFLFELSFVTIMLIYTNARDELNNTPLHTAVLCGKDDVVLTLIKDFGCDTKVIGWKGRFLLHRACQGAVSISYMNTMLTPLPEIIKTTHHYAWQHWSENTKSLKLLLMSLASFKRINKSGRSVLHMAYIGGNVALALALIFESNADVSERDHDNNTPLHLAALNDQDEMVMMLITILVVILRCEVVQVDLYCTLFVPKEMFVLFEH